MCTYELHPDCVPPSCIYPCPLNVFLVSYCNFSSYHYFHVCTTSRIPNNPIDMKSSILFCFIGLGAALHLVPSRPTKKFELNLTWDTKAPDGVERQQALINGQFPGPPLIFDEDDNVEVTVNNFLPYNTTMHWHGIE